MGEPISMIGAALFSAASATASAIGGAATAIGGAASAIGGASWLTGAVGLAGAAFQGFSSVQAYKERKSQAEQEFTRAKEQQAAALDQLRATREAAEFNARTIEERARQLRVEQDESLRLLRQESARQEGTARSRAAMRGFTMDSFTDTLAQYDEELKIAEQNLFRQGQNQQTLLAREATLERMRGQAASTAGTRVQAWELPSGTGGGMGTLALGLGNALTSGLSSYNSIGLGQKYTRGSRVQELEAGNVGAL